ncbi:hypothetical protein FEM48_Zijuj04G0133100 [Ziziphus jujuba var. spinosa]|uniref:WRKY domain-containing protein n=1 Tax=Ziziphus jujuba var. spinosa TaxID=714518 RepID=A0A978VK42_ZIZJJ|nr:hypothetical protein FEM48_Zijuj04G0133100 [Ziziphus jujuba var. spinosa]
MVPEGETVTDEVASDKSQRRENSINETHTSQETPSSRVSSLPPNEEGRSSFVKPEQATKVQDSAVRAMSLNQEGKSSTMVLEKASKTPGTCVPASQSGQESSTPTIIREKMTEDGYNWRKYGQKLVKGNEYVRSYYKCTHPNCLVKKQLERSHDGQIVDTIYFGQHEHPKPQLNIPVAVGFVVSIVEERRDEPSLTTAEDTPMDEHGQMPVRTEPVDAPKISNVAANDSGQGVLVQSNKIKDEVFNDDDPDSKRRSVDKPTSESRIVVQTLSEVDIVNDGYRWRKYGQKLVKGNPNPRSYYRCSNPGCPVKKHVERASHDQKVVIATYEGQHDHDIPPVRTVTHNTTGSSVLQTAHDDDAGTKTEDVAVCPPDRAHKTSDHESKSKDQLNGELKTRSGVSGVAASDKVTKSCSGAETKSNEQQNGKSAISEASSPVKVVEHSNSAVVSRPNDQVKGETRNKLEGNAVCHDNLGPESKISERQKPNAEPVHS